MEKTTCYCCAFCNSKVGIIFLNTQRARTLHNFFYCYKVGVNLLLTKMYYFITTGVSWATLHFIVVSHCPMKTFLIIGVYAVFTKSVILLMQFRVKMGHNVALTMRMYFSN